MPDLPITNNETPLLIPSEIKPIQPSTPDHSNPYSYPTNPTTNTTQQQQQQENIPLNDTTSFNEGGDPELLKLKSSFWKKAGQLQSAIGSLTGMESLQTTGNKTEREAEREYKEAEERLHRGEASRLHGEYDRLMGYMTYAVGHISGDADMQAKANERTLHGSAEIDKSSSSHH